MEVLTESKTVLITGASAGIGAELAREYHARGLRVGLLARRLDRLQALETELNTKRPESALSLMADLSDPAQFSSAVQKMLGTFGRIDGLVANAGFGVAGRVDSLTVEDYRRQFDTNVFPVIHGFQLVREELVKNGGFFCAVGSVNSYLSLPTASAYAMSKFSVRALMEALYWEMKPLGVSVTLVCPGFVRTEIRKVNNRGEYREQAKEPVPEWLMMDATVAARQILRSIERKKPEAVITLHGKILVWIQRHFPWMLIPVHRGSAGAREKWNGDKNGT
jgi:short-subunit dehydrogenase